MVHVFGSGHSRIMVEEMWPRYGSFPGIQSARRAVAVVPSSGGRQQWPAAGDVSGKCVGPRGPHPAKLRHLDGGLGAGGELERLQRGADRDRRRVSRPRRVRGRARQSRPTCEASKSQRADGKKLTDFADVVLDTGAPVGDSMVQIEGLETPVAPGSTVGGCMVVNSIKAEVAERLVAAGQPPRVLTAAAVVGARAGDRAVRSGLRRTWPPAGQVVRLAR